MEGSTSFRFAHKLKSLKEKILRWKKEEFRGLESRKVKCLQKIESLKTGDIEGVLEEEERAEREFQRVLKMEEISSKQKSRIAWLKKRDQNTKYFHKMASWRGAVNSMSKLKVDGEWLYDQDQIREAMENYYINLYTNPMPVRPVLEGVKFDCINPDQSRWMERPFSEEEILVPKGMEEDKMPRPDEFPTKFIVVWWGGGMFWRFLGSFKHRIYGAKA